MNNYGNANYEKYFSNECTYREGASNFGLRNCFNFKCLHGFWVTLIAHQNESTLCTDLKEGMYKVPYPYPFLPGGGG